MKSESTRARRKLREIDVGSAGLDLQHDDDGGATRGETIDPVTGEVQMTLPLWTQGTLLGMGCATGNDVEEGEQPPLSAHG